MPQPPQFLGSVFVSAQAPKQLTPLLHRELQVLPSHDAVAPAGSGQGVHDEPQLVIELLLTHVPLQSW
jgi:hypothetical protein